MFFACNWTGVGISYLIRPMDIFEMFVGCIHLYQNRASKLLDFIARNRSVTFFQLGSGFFF